MVFGRPLIYSWQYHLFWIIVLRKILPCLNDMDGIKGWLENCQCNARHINHSLHWNKPQTLRCALYWYMKSSKLLAIWKYDQYFSWQILCKIWYALCIHYTGSGYTKTKNQKWKYAIWHWYSTMKINFMMKNSKMRKHKK